MPAELVPFTLETMHMKQELETLSGTEKKAINYDEGKIAGI